MLFYGLSSKVLDYNSSILPVFVYCTLWSLLSAFHRAIQEMFSHAQSNQGSSGTPARIKKRFISQYMPLEDVELLERYRLGGYHRIVVGECLHDRYHIVHKLGHGTYSTIWLARDQRRNIYVAIKIMLADSASEESHILRLLTSTAREEITCPGKHSVPTVLAEFTTHGPNGEHRCLVTAPARMSIADAKNSAFAFSRLFQLPVARVLVAQLVQLVAHLHSRGIVHGGEPVLFGIDLRRCHMPDLQTINFLPLSRFASRQCVTQLP